MGGGGLYEDLALTLLNVNTTVEICPNLTLLIGLYCHEKIELGYFSYLSYSNEASYFFVFMASKSILVKPKFLSTGGNTPTPLHSILYSLFPSPWHIVGM